MPFERVSYQATTIYPSEDSWEDTRSTSAWWSTPTAPSSPRVDRGFRPLMAGVDHACCRRSSNDGRVRTTTRASRSPTSDRCRVTPGCRSASPSAMSTGAHRSAGDADAAEGGASRRATPTCCARCRCCGRWLRRACPVAEVVWWDADEQWFEVPYFMVRFLPRRDLCGPRAVAGVRAVSTCADVPPLGGRGARARAPRRPSLAVLPDWEAAEARCAPRSSSGPPILQKAAEPEWIAMGGAHPRAAAATLPADARRRHLPRRLPDEQHPVRRVVGRGRCSTGRSAASAPSCSTSAGCCS